MSEWDVITRTVAGLIAGGAIGFERSFHGRAAGLRTYAIVSFGSALLVAAAQYGFGVPEHGDGDVTRVIQGIVTGIGFLGAGVIVREGFTVRGLTTAASIWVASVIGIVMGYGAFLSGAQASVVTLIALAILRRVEDRLPAQSYVHVDVAFDRSAVMDEGRFRALLDAHGFTMREFAYRLDDEPPRFEYRTIVWSKRPEAIRTLNTTLLEKADVVRFSITPTRA
jgi:putative Mg2+ transporter-C (MgtC) family protein